MNNKDYHLLGLAIKYLIKANQVVHDTTVNSYIKKLQAVHKRIDSKDGEVLNVTVLQYDLGCHLKGLYKVMRKAGLLDKRNKSQCKYLKNERLVYFSPAGNRCVTTKVVFNKKDKQKILQRIKAVNK